MPNQGKLLKTLKYLGLSFVKSLPWFVIETHGSKLSTICLFEVCFLSALASWLCRLHSFWLYKFWAAIFLAGQGMS